MAPNKSLDGPNDDEQIAIKRNAAIEEETALRVRVLRMQEQREIMLLEETETSQKERAEKKRLRSEQNKQRQANLAAARASDKNIQNFCRHKQGGFRHKLYQGDGKPCVTNFVMPDGVTNFLQCQRCHTKVQTPHLNLLARDPKAYAEQKALHDKLLELWEESGLDLIKGPTFIFTKFGVPFVPEHLAAGV